MPVLMLSRLIKLFLVETKMRLLSKILMTIPLLCSTAWAVEVAAPVAAAPLAQHQAVTVIPAVANSNAVATVKAQQTVASTSAEIPATKPLTAEQIAKQKAAIEAKVKALVKDQASRLQQLEKANLDALAQNQELQLKNDNLGVQVQVLQSERSAQMFLYGAATIAIGIFVGFLIASYIYTKRRRQW